MQHDFLTQNSVFAERLNGDKALKTRSFLAARVLEEREFCSFRVRGDAQFGILDSLCTKNCSGVVSERDGGVSKRAACNVALNRRRKRLPQKEFS
jgi:hypothetical protein